MTHQDFERRVSLLLRRTAEGVPPDLDLMPAIARRLAEGAAPHARRARAIPVRRWTYPVAAAALVLALVVSAFTWAKPLIFQWLGNPGNQEIMFERATTINRSVTVAGITLHVEQIYADAALTAVSLQLTGPNQQFGYDGEPQLVGTDGTRYQMVTSAGFNQDFLVEFEPLPLDHLSTPQTFTLTIPSIRYGQTSTGPASTISGPWQLTFTVIPQAGSSIVLDVAPITHDGVTIQPLRLDLAPTGARLLVRFSGLAPNTELFALKHFVTHIEIAGVLSSNGLGLSAGIAGGSTSDGGPLQLIGPDGQRLIPSWIALPNLAPAADQGVPLNRQVVGPDGSVVLSILFYTPLHATTGTAHLTLDHVDVATRDAQGNESERLAHGPWSFDLPLSSR